MDKQPIETVLCCQYKLKMRNNKVKIYVV